MKKRVEDIVECPCDCPLENFISFLQKRLERIPKSYRKSARIELLGHDERPVYARIYYSRPETRREIERREAASKPLGYAALERAFWQDLRSDLSRAIEANA